jgi:hypothetical protein
VDEFSPPEHIRQVRVRGRAERQSHDPKRVQAIYRRYLGDDRAKWPDQFRVRPEDPTWALWTVLPSSGLVVAYPNFEEHQIRWQELRDSPLADNPSTPVGSN